MLKIFFISPNFGELFFVPMNLTVDLKIEIYFLMWRFVRGKLLLLCYCLIFVLKKEKNEWEESGFPKITFWEAKVTFLILKSHRPNKALDQFISRKFSKSAKKVLNWFGKKINSRFFKSILGFGGCSQRPSSHPSLTQK